MLDLGLLRVPTFGGGLAAAWAISAALFAMFTYLTVYLQNSLGLSAVATGVRFLPLTVAIFVTAGIAGRLTSRVPRRLLIAPGFLLIGAGLLLMRGLTPSSGWTHLLAGMIVCGIGGGLVSTPLDLDRRRRRRAGPGRDGLRDQLDPAPGRVSRPAWRRSARSSSRTCTASVLDRPAAARRSRDTRTRSRTRSRPAAAPTRSPRRRRRSAGWWRATARSALVQGLNTIMLISAVVAFAAAVASFVLIRERDFVTLDEGETTEELELAVAA